jgi:nicotinamide riboside kinase
MGNGAVRDGDYKFLKILNNTFLFNVVEDPLEHANRKERQKSIYHRLVQEWNDWNASMLPEIKESFTLQLRWRGTCRPFRGQESRPDAGHSRPARRLELPSHQTAICVKLGAMKRVVIIGRGASGKSTLARRLGDITRLPVIEVDKIFWRPGLIATPREQWVIVQEKLVAGDRWIMDGDLGPYDAVEVRLRAADTIIFLDFSLVRCAWQAIRRSRERADFWRLLLAYRHQSRPILRAAIANHAPNAVLHVFRGPKALGRFVDSYGATASAETGNAI